MNCFLDLAQFKDETFDVKLPDSGEIINITKPTQRMYIYFTAFSNAGEKEMTERAEKKRLNECVLKILNNNQNGRKFTLEDIKSWHTLMKAAVVKGYAEFINHVISQKNL